MIMYNGSLIKTNGYSGTLFFPLPTTLIMPLSIILYLSLDNNFKVFVTNLNYTIIPLILENVFQKEAMR